MSVMVAPPAACMLALMAVNALLTKTAACSLNLFDCIIISLATANCQPRRPPERNESL